MFAIEAGLLSLADKLLADPKLDPAIESQGFINAESGFDDALMVIAGVIYILSERWSEDAALAGTLRTWLWEDGLFKSKLMEGKDQNDPEVSKFRDYFDYEEPIKTVPSHRALAVFRGRTQEILDAKLV